MADANDLILNLSNTVNTIASNINLNDAIDGQEEEEETLQVETPIQEDVVEPVTPPPPPVPEVENYDYIPRTSGDVIKISGVPEKPKLSWVEKFGTAREIMWIDQLYENSDFANDFTAEDGWKIEADELKELSIKYDTVWYEDIIKSQSQNEYSFKVARAENALRNYQKLGDMGFGTITAMLAAGLTDPAYIPLYFVPYGRLAAGAKQFQGATRLAKYMKTGAVVGAAEGTLVGGVDYMLRPDAQLYEIFYGTALGGTLGGAIGAVQARLMRDIDAEHFINNQIELTQKGMAKFKNHTPEMKNKRTVDALLPKDKDTTKPITTKQKVPVVEGKVKKEKTGLYRYTTDDEEYSIQKIGSRWHVRKEQTIGQNADWLGIAGGTRSTHTSLKKATAALNEEMAAKKAKQEPTTKQSEEQEFIKQSQKDLQDEFGSPNQEKIKEDTLDLKMPDNPDDVPKLVRNMFDWIGLRKRLSAVTRLTQSDNPETRFYGMHMALVSGGLKDKSGKLVQVPQNASIFHQIFFRKYMGRLAKTLQQVNTKNKTQNQVNEDIFHVLNGRTDIELSDSAMNAVKEIDNMRTEMFEVAKKLRIVDETQRIEDYMPRMLQPQLIDSKLVANATPKDIKQAFYKLLKNNNPDMDDGVLRKAAGSYWKSISETIHRERYTRTGASRYATSLDEDTVRVLLRELEDESGVKLSEEQLDQLLQTQTTKNAKSRNVHSRSRLNIDDKTTVKIPFKKGHERYGESFDFKLTDIVDTNVERVMGTYIHRMAGATALARIGIDGDESFVSIINRIREKNVELGISSETSQAEIRALEYIYEALRGSYNINEGMDTLTRKGLRRLRELNFIRLMGVSGLAAVIETSNVLVENGLRTALRNIPAFRSIIKRTKEGNLSNELAREIEDSFGIGTDVITGKMNSRYEDYTDNMHLFSSDYTKTDEVLAKGRNFVSKFGGLTPVTVMLSRWNSQNFAKNMFNKLSKNDFQIYSDVKMKQLSLSKESLVEIKKMMDKHAVKNSDGSLKTLNLHKWEVDNPKAYDDFSYALTVDTSNNVQVTNIGSGNPFIRSEWGKTLFQFWNFVLGSNEQQFARQMVRLQYGDPAVPVSVFLGGLTIATLAYTARTHLNSLGRADREEYLAEKLSEGNLARVAFSYMGILGMNTFMFNQAGFSSDTLIKNPSVQLLDSILSGVGKTADAAIDLDGHSTLYELSRLAENLSPNHPFSGVPMRYLSEQAIGDPD